MSAAQPVDGPPQGPQLPLHPQQQKRGYRDGKTALYYRFYERLHRKNLLQEATGLLKDEILSLR
jgi:hypothetical protein